ncbi:hypothetical protein XH89_09925 [Bradyrhizobium sp. CCBAU 53340]|nr:hypothetical protein XH89_09925 [Bradyrhizobium sp. CCBAU 53340]
MMPGFLFEAASAFVELVSLGPHAPAAPLTIIAANSTTAFLVILAMTFRLILPRRHRWRRLAIRTESRSSYGRPKRGLGRSHRVPESHKIAGWQ